LLDITFPSRSRTSGRYHIFGAVVVSLLVGAQSEVDDFAAGRGRDLGGFDLLWVSNGRRAVLVLAAGEMKESDVVLESVLLL